MKRDAENMSLFVRTGGRAELMKMLRHFYADVRQHQIIGPIFRAQISDWAAHLETIADFWSGAMGGPARYAGPMPQKHFPLDLGAEHFEAWLELWRRHCRIQFAAAEAEEMILLAEGLGQRMRRLIAQNPPGTPPPEGL